MLVRKGQALGHCVEHTGPLPEQEKPLLWLLRRSSGRCTELFNHFRQLFYPPVPQRFIISFRQRKSLWAQHHANWTFLQRTFQRGAGIQACETTSSSAEEPRSIKKAYLMSTSPKTWLVTGVARGNGADSVKAALVAHHCGGIQAHGHHTQWLTTLWQRTGRVFYRRGPHRPPVRGS